MIDLILGNGVVAGIIGAALALIGAWWAGRKSGTARAKAERADAYEAEMERIEKAASARRDAERRARAGELRDEWSRD